MVGKVEKGSGKVGICTFSEWVGEGFERIYTRNTQVFARGFTRDFHMKIISHRVFP